MHRTAVILSLHSPRNVKSPIMLLCMPLLLAVCWLAPGVVKADGFPLGWAHRVPITINHDQIDENLTDFTLVLTEEMSAVLSSVDGPLDADGLRPSIDGGGDVRFSADEAGTQRLAVDVREWDTDNDPASGSLEVAVKVPSISSSTDTTIYLWWGNSEAVQPGPAQEFGQYAAYDAGAWLASADGGASDRTGQRGIYPSSSPPPVQITGRRGSTSPATTAYSRRTTAGVGWSHQQGVGKASSPPPTQKSAHPPSVIPQ